MRALVTGAAGFSGRRLARHLAGKGFEVHGVSRPGNDAPIEGVARRHRCQPEDGGALTAIVREVRPDLVFHLAGIAVAKSVADFYRVNVLYAANLVSALEETGLDDRPLLLVGSGAEYGPVAPEAIPIVETAPARPHDHHGASKLAQTRLGELAAARLPVVVARPFNVIGPGMPEHLALGSFARQLAAIASGRRPPVIEVGNLSSARDFIDVDDAVSTYLELVRCKAARGQVVNVCSGKAVVLSELLERLIAASGLEGVEVRVDPKRFKPVDVPIHRGSRARLEALVGRAAELSPLDETLERIMASAREEAA